MLGKVTFTAVLFGGVLVFGATRPMPEIPAPLPYGACAYEDSPGPCGWDAARQGNGQGTGFIRLGNGETVPLDRVEVRDGCTWWIGPTSVFACPDGVEES